MAQAPQGQSDALNEGRRIYLGPTIFADRIILNERVIG